MSCSFKTLISSPILPLLQSVALAGATPLYQDTLCSHRIVYLLLYSSFFLAANTWYASLHCRSYSTVLSFCKLAFLSWVFSWSSKLTRRSLVYIFHFFRFLLFCVVRRQPCVTKGYIYTSLLFGDPHGLKSLKFQSDVAGLMYRDFENTGNVCHTSCFVSLLSMLWFHLFVRSFDFGLFKVAVFISDCTASKNN